MEMVKIHLPAGKQKIVVIVGPTASGKSGLGIKIARKFKGEIISADSRQVYRRMDMGTGKVVKDRDPKSETNSKFKIQNEYYSEGIKHHLLDVASPKKQFTADDFKKLGEEALGYIQKNKKIPIIVGGTGFYIDILLRRMAVAQVPPNIKLRAKLEKQSAEQLFKALKKLHPSYSKVIDRQNKHRLIRAIEIITKLGKMPKIERDDDKYRILWLGLKPADLEAKIKKRLDLRLNRGMIKEVAKLHYLPAGRGVSWQRLDKFGLEYRWISRYIKNQKSKIKINAENFRESKYYEILLKEIIKYSKRQMTWFKKNKEIIWIKDGAEAFEQTKKFLANLMN